VTDNTEVSIFYDPMISKLAVWGRDRSEAIDRMRRALDEYTVGGIRTTLPFFREIIRDSEFIEGKLDTGFISCWFERRERVLAEKTAEDDEIRLDMAIIAAALDYQNQTKTNSAAAAQTGTNGAPESRWKIAGRAALHRSRI
jgi:acetyl/propionyl-CoA carboxylase alpha subunit